MAATINIPLEAKEINILTWGIIDSLNRMASRIDSNAYIEKLGELCDLYRKLHSHKEHLNDKEELANGD